MWYINKTKLQWQRSCGLCFWDNQFKIIMKLSRNEWRLLTDMMGWLTAVRHIRKRIMVAQATVIPRQHQKRLISLVQKNEKKKGENWRRNYAQDKGKAFINDADLLVGWRWEPIFEHAVLKICLTISWLHVVSLSLYLGPQIGNKSG